MADGIVDIISKLGIDATEVYSELDKVNAKYGQSTEIIRKQQKELAELTKFEQGLLAQRAKSNNPSVQAQFTKEIEKTQAKMKALTTTITEQTVALKNEKIEADKLKKGLDNAFDGTKAKSLKSQLRELKAQLAETDDDEEFLKLSIAAGKLEDRIGDASTAARIFASDSKFEVVGNAIGNMGQKLLALDFDGLLQGSQLFLEASQQITFADAIGGIKQLGKTLANVGQALLSNPLFLIAGAAALIIGNFDKISEAITGTARRMAQLTKTYEAQKLASELLVRQGERELALAEAQGKSDKEILEIKRKIIFAKIEEAKAAIIFNKSKQLEVDTNDSLWESYLRLSGAINEFTGVNANQNAALILLNKSKKDANKENIEAAREAEENLKDLLNQLNVDKAAFEKKTGDKSNEDAKKRAEERLALAKKIRDLEISNITDEAEKAKAVAVAKYNDEFALAKGNAQLIGELRIQLDNELNKIDKETAEKQQALLDAEVQAREDANQKIVDADKESKLKIQAQAEDDLSEQQRHITALLSIRLQGNKDAEVILLANEIAFEKKRLDQIKEFHGVASEEYIKQANKIEELETKLVENLNKIDKSRINQVIANTKQIIDEVIKGAQQVLAAETQKVDKQISLQQRRVDEVAKIAENGNAKLLELEKERLDKLNKEKEKFVRAQQVLASIELVANTAVTVSKAAAEGGAGAAFTIAAALIALVAGLASARSIAGQAAFYDGGFTGEGNPREESKAVGGRPYIYHKAEFVHDHKTTKKFRQIFQDVHEGKIDLNRMKFESDMYKTLRAAGINTGNDIQFRQMQGGSQDFTQFTKHLERVEGAIKGQSRLKLVIDRNGISAITSEYIKDRKRIDTIAG